MSNTTITAPRPDWQSATRPDGDWTRVVVPTHVDRHPVFVTIKWHDGELSITGVEGPKRNGDAWGGCGQIRLAEGTPAKGWTREAVEKLAEIWDRWHLNKLTAGSPAQEAWVREHRDEFPGYPTSFYDWACEGLAAAELHPDPSHDDYRYGSAWLSEDVPEDVLDWLFELPNTLKAHPWGRG